MLSRCDRIAEDPHYRKGEPVRDLFARDREAMAPMPGTRFDACRWEVRKADGEGCVSVDSQPLSRGSVVARVDARRRACARSTRGIRTRDGRRVGKLPRAYGGGHRHGAGSGGAAARVGQKTARVGREPHTRGFPRQAPGSGIDAMESRERQRTLRLIHRASESAGFDAAARAAEHLVGRGHGIDEVSLMAMSRRIAAGETPHDEPAPDPRRLRSVHATGRRPEGGMMTKPGTAQPGHDDDAARSTTGRMTERDHGNSPAGCRRPARYWPTNWRRPRPRRREFMHAWMNAEIESRERSKRTRLPEQADPRNPGGLRLAPCASPSTTGGRHWNPSTSSSTRRTWSCSALPGTGQDPPGHRAGPAGLPGGRTDQVLHRRRARHATTARQRGEQARPGARHGSAGPGSWSSTSSDTSRSTRKAAASCSRSPPTRTKDRASSYTTNIEFSGWGRIFGDPNTARRLSIDRTVHHGRMTGFEGDSYRKTHALMQ